MAKTYEIVQGDLGDLVLVGLADGTAMDANYTCTMAIEGTTISRPITDKNADNTKFQVQLATTESAQLKPGQTYTMAVKIENGTLSPVFSREAHIRLDVKANIA